MFVAGNSGVWVRLIDSCSASWKSSASCSSGDLIGGGESKMGSYVLYWVKSWSRLISSSCLFGFEYRYFH